MKRKKHWSNQHHTAKRIYKRLRDEYGFTGSYDSIQKFVQKIPKNIQTKGTQDLIWEPGCAQVDFGEDDFYEDTDCVRWKYLTVSFPYSNDGYSQVFRGETAECVCQGLADMFRRDTSYCPQCIGCFIVADFVVKRPGRLSVSRFLLINAI